MGDKFLVSTDGQLIRGDFRGVFRRCRGGSAGRGYRVVAGGFVVVGESERDGKWHASAAAIQGILRARNRSGDGGRLSPLLAVHQAAAGGRTRPHMHEVRAFGWVLDKVAPTCPCRQARGRALPAPQRKFDYSWAEEASPSLASPTSSSASRLRAGRETATGARWPGRRSPPARSRRPGRTASRSARAFQRR